MNSWASTDSAVFLLFSADKLSSQPFHSSTSDHYWPLQSTIYVASWPILFHLHLFKILKIEEKQNINPNTLHVFLDVYYCENADCGKEKY